MTTYTHNTYQPEESPQAPISTRNDINGQTGGTTTVTISGGSATTETSKVNTIKADQLSPFADDDWRSTATKDNGFRTNEITADSIVQIGGMQAHVRDFVSAGVLQANPDGSFSMATGETQEAPQANPDAASMPSEMAGAVNAALEPFSDSALESTMPLAIAAVSGEMDMAAVIHTAAHRTGLEPADAEQRVEFVMDAYRAQAMNYLGKNGLDQADMDAFYEFAVTQRSDFKSALQKQVYGNDLSGWKPLISKFMSSSAPSAAVLESNGFQVNGDQVRIQGVWMSIQQAAKAGFI